FAQILRIPCEGACVFSDRWSHDELVYGAPSEGPYQTYLHSHDDIILFIREDQEGQVTRIRHQEEVRVQDYQILTHEIVSTLKHLEEIIQENVFCLGERKPERIVAREEVIIPLPPPPSMNHLHLISTMMMEIIKGPRTSKLSTTSKSSLLVTLSLSPITPLDHIHETPSPPSPPQPQPPIMGHPLFYNYPDYHGSTRICCSHNRSLFFTLREEMNIMFAHLEYLLTTAITSHILPPP
nr:hypothetical protein [Tanacetum cinerariifolium]